MAHLFFFFAAVAASLLWTALFTAVAARVKPFGYLLRIIAVGIPVLFWLPWLDLTARLAWWANFSLKSPVNWFGPTLTAFLSVLIGGLFIVRAGLSPRRGMPAGRWPIARLAVGFGAALLAASTTLAILEQDLKRWAVGLRAEATGMIMSVVPPPLAADANAATAYREAQWLSKTAFAIPPEQILRLFGDNPLPVASEEVGEVLKRQAPLLDLIRRGTQREECRFDRDWTQHCLEMLIDETEAMRALASLLTLSARRQAADGQPAEALVDVARLGRMAEHVAREPLPVSSLTGMDIDRLALGALAEVLSQVTRGDQLNAIDPLHLCQATEFRNAVKNSLLCDEATILNTAAHVADKRIFLSTLCEHVMWLDPVMKSPAGMLPILRHWLDSLYRTFVLRGEVEDLRTRFDQFANHCSRWFYEQRAPVARRKEARDLDYLPGAGIYATMFKPVYVHLQDAVWRSEALHNIAGVLLAATRYRLATGALPESLAALVPDYLPSAPADLFAPDNAVLRLVSTDSAWTVYSLGNNGRDDGGPGPQPDDKEPGEGKDDIGLSMKR